MNRFMGMMPSSEVKKEKRFRVGHGQLIVTIQSGENGWTIMYADNSSEYKDVLGTTEENFNKAMSVLNSRFDNINEVKQKNEKIK